MRIWVGGFRPKVLSLAGRLADGFNVAYVSPTIWETAWSRVKEAALRAGRRPEEIGASVNVGLFVRPTVEEAHRECLATMGPQVSAMGGHLLDPVEEVVATVEKYRTAGVERMNIVLRPPVDLSGLGVFAREVMHEFGE